MPWRFLLPNVDVFLGNKFQAHAGRAFLVGSDGHRCADRTDPDSHIPKVNSGFGINSAGVQIEKDVPQPQDAVALGFLIWNDAPIRSSTKSISEPSM